jgi:DNA (cytosine-5)-methyltransferase 1
MITIGTDCSGIEAPLQALKGLKIQYIQKWSCEIDKYARLSSEANYKKPEKVYTDMLTRDNSLLPHVDLYVCGFPCQSFSNMGNRLGTSDPRSKIIPKMIDTIKYSKPKICILENVRGFMTIENGKPCKMLIEELQKLGYNVNHSIYNTKDYGIPQNRERVYFVCIRKDIQKKEYIRPKKSKIKSFKRILENLTINKEQIPSMYRNNNIDFEKDGYTVVNNNYNKLQFMRNNSPTLTTTAKYYILELNRNLTLKETLRLQGFPSSFKIVVSNNQLMKQIGNSMSVNVLKKIIQEAINCVILLK